MPRYPFQCVNCGEFEEESRVLTCGPCDCPRCGSSALKLFAPTTNLVVPDYMRAENSHSQSKQKAFMDSPKTKKLRDEGKLAPPDEADQVTREYAATLPKPKTADQIYEQAVRDKVLG